MGVGRSVASKSVSVTIGVGAEWHCITTVDWLSVRLSFGSDGERYPWAGGPFWGGHDNSASAAVTPVAGRCIAEQQMPRVATRGVGRAQSDSIPAVNDGISMTFQSENRITSSYFTAAFSVNLGDAMKMAKLTWNCTTEFLFSLDVLINGFHEISEFQQLRETLYSINVNRGRSIRVCKFADR